MVKILMEMEVIMSGINKVILLGRLGHDPEVKYTPDGTAVTSFSVATSQQWKDKEGQKQERTEWTRVVAWRKLAEICAQYLAKGRQVYIEGRMQTRQWEKDGVTRYATEVIANEVLFVGSRSDGDQDRMRDPVDYPEAAGGTSQASPVAGVNNDDDIPF